MKVCAKYNIVVLIHTGDGPYTIPTMFYPIIREFPMVNFIIGHFGIQTGGNYSFFSALTGMEHVGFPIAEVADDGSSIITKHPGTGGAVTVGTVTAQLLDEVGGAAYANPDATARFDSLTLAQEGADRVRISGVAGETPPERLKVAANYLGGFRNSMTLVVTGLDAEAKADLALRTTLVEAPGEVVQRHLAPGQRAQPRIHAQPQQRHTPHPSYCCSHLCSSLIIVLRRDWPWPAEFLG